MKQSSKQIHLEILRIVACFFVIINHTIGGITLFYNDSFSYKAAMLLLVLCRTAVPIFIMISGAVLIPKEESIKQVLMRIVRVVVVFIGFTLIYYIRYIMKMGGGFSVRDYLYLIWTGEITNAYWYIYLYIAILIMLPIYRIIAKNMEAKMAVVYFGLWFAFVAVLPTICQWTSAPYLNSNFNLALLSGYSVYFLAGHYINNVLSDELVNKGKGAIAFSLYLVLCICGTIIMYDEARRETMDIFYEDRMSFMVVLSALFLFYALRCFAFENVNAKKAIIFVSSATFGIYLLSDMFIEICYPIRERLGQHMEPIGAMIVYEISVFVVCLLIVKVIKLIPGVNKYI